MDVPFSLCPLGFPRFTVFSYLGKSNLTLSLSSPDSKGKMIAREAESAEIFSGGRFDVFEGFREAWKMEFLFPFLPEHEALGHFNLRVLCDLCGSVLCFLFLGSGMNG
jgi:hypothetical protein